MGPTSSVYNPAVKATPAQRRRNLADLGRQTVERPHTLDHRRIQFALKTAPVRVEDVRADSEHRGVLFGEFGPALAPIRMRVDQGAREPAKRGGGASAGLPEREREW